MDSKKKKYKNKSAQAAADANKNSSSSTELAENSWSKNDILLNILLAVAVLVVAIQLFSYASGAYFFTDEGFHGVLSRHAARFSFPINVPEMFTEMRNIQPPLLHATSGFMAAVFGESAFKYMNVIFLNELSPLFKKLALYLNT